MALRSDCYAPDSTLLFGSTMPTTDAADKPVSTIVLIELEIIMTQSARGT
ncbi:hypothetical protein HMPREF9004_0602 [Schaalia cardiffensis F0333]|uniref:Uncharacterized protein n=1 Tax=Schaalia cardiffensis F0333 TaxID=888050 RepID=N6XBI8_9ACTO|nr:hypothetical protein HMPREF9004_0602 [Schaalia cardiffensis F0333]